MLILFVEAFGSHCSMLPLHRVEVDRSYVSSHDLTMLPIKVSHTAKPMQHETPDHTAAIEFSMCLDNIPSNGD
jgi:hypothetical protein